MPVDADVLEEFIENSGASFKRNSVSYIFNCPRCLKEKLYLRRRDGRFICFVCAESSNFRGRAEFALAEICAMPLFEVREALYGESSKELPDVEYLDINFGQDEEEELPAPIPTVAWPFDYYPITDTHSVRGLGYLEGRGIPGSVAAEYGIRYSPTERRVAFPIEVDGKLVGWQKRLVVDNRSWDEEAGKWRETPKILSSKQIPRDRVLMFQDRLNGSSHAVLCEGPIDAMKAHLCGGNVCSMGKVVSRAQVELLQKHQIQKLYLALDPDAAAEASRVLREFAGIDCYLMKPPAPFKDLGDMTMEAVLELFRSAPLLDPGHLFVFLRGWK